MRIRIALLLLAFGLATALIPEVGSGARIPQIVGGTIAAPGAWPWMADVTMRISASDGTFEGSCGGSLIGDRWVLTAGHCFAFDAAELGGNAAVTSVRVRIGASDLAIPGETTIVSTAFFINPTFDLATFRRDFALIRLPEAVTDQAIGIPTTADAARWAPGTVATVIGWGALNEGGQFDTKRRQVDVPIVSDATCGSPADYGAEFDPGSMICAGYAEGGRDSCFGDSGGPLLVPAGPNSWLQAGIVSWGDGCARPNKPGVYAAVGALLPSILGILTADPVSPVSADRDDRRSIATERRRRNDRRHRRSRRPRDLLPGGLRDDVVLRLLGLGLCRSGERRRNHLAGSGRSGSVDHVSLPRLGHERCGRSRRERRGVQDDRARVPRKGFADR